MIVESADEHFVIGAIGCVAAICAEESVSAREKIGASDCVAARDPFLDSSVDDAILVQAGVRIGRIPGFEGQQRGCRSVAELVGNIVSSFDDERVIAVVDNQWPVPDRASRRRASRSRPRRWSPRCKRRNARPDNGCVCGARSRSRGRAPRSTTNTISATSKARFALSAAHQKNGRPHRLISGLGTADAFAAEARTSTCHRHYERDLCQHVPRSRSALRPEWDRPTFGDDG